MGIRSAALTAVLSTVTHLASSWFLLLFLPLGFWLWNKCTFGRLGVLNALTALLSAHLKVVYMLPRPDPSFYLMGFSGWSFPSGHAQHAVVTWMWLAREINKPWSWITGLLLTLVIALSRVYLGVHFGRDVVAGLLAGAATLLAFEWMVGAKPTRWQKLRWPWRMGILVLFQIVWLVLIHGEGTTHGFLPSAIALGFMMGFLGRHHLGALKEGWRIFLTALLALSIWLVIETGGYFSIDSAVPAFIHFTLWGAWMSLIAPGLLQTLRLTKREPAAQ